MSNEDCDRCKIINNKLSIKKYNKRGLNIFNIDIKKMKKRLIIVLKL